MAYDFDGTDDYIETATAVVTAAQLSMACLFNSDSITAQQALMSIHNGTENQMFNLQAMGSIAGDPIRAQTVAGGSAVNADSATGYSLTTWTHAAARFASATDRRAYINGVGGTANTTSRTPSGVNTTALGYVYAAGVRARFLNGRLAEAAIWNTDLTDDEFAALADGYRPTLIRPNKLVFYAPLIREALEYRGGLSLTVSAPVVAVHTRRIG